MKDFALGNSEIAEVCVLDGAIYALGTYAAVQSQLSLEIGERPFGFAPVKVTDLPIELHRQQVFQCDAFPRKLANSDGQLSAEARLNELQDWSLSGAQTLQINIGPDTCESRYTLVSRVSVRQGLRRFRLGLAAHRVRGRLEISIFAPQPKQLVSKLQFNDDYTGGQHARGYDWHEIELPTQVGAADLQIDLIHETVDGDDDGFYFVAGAELADETSFQTNVYRQVFASARKDMSWFRANFRTLPSAHEEISLQLGAEKVQLSRPNLQPPQIVHDLGHAIQIDCADETDLTLYQNGKFLSEVFAGKGRSSHALPCATATSEPTIIEIRDAMGLRSFDASCAFRPSQLTPYSAIQKEVIAPYPGPLAPQAAHRYVSMAAHLHDGKLGANQQRQLSHALKTLEGDEDRAELRHIKFAPPKNPDVSVIIPAHNHFKVTYSCLCSLLLAHNNASFEVILVDDGSSDETARIEDFVSGIKVVRNEQPLRFIRACNAGVERAKGRYVALLNNDTEVTNGWLDALIGGLEKLPGVGLVGAKLLYPDGRLQDAGGIVWRGGVPWNYGRGANPWAPEFCYARQVDYLCGAALMLPRQLWHEVGGLSHYLEPMYFEDADLAFKIREAGYQTWFVPSAIVYHKEGCTSGTDLGVGMKHYQVLNHPKFKERWAGKCAKNAPVGVAPDIEKDRNISGRVLFLDTSVPRPDQDAGSCAALTEMSLVQSLGFKVTFLPENLAWLGRYTEDLQNRGIEVISAPFFTSIDDFLSKRGNEFDAIYITRYTVAQSALPSIRRHASQAKVLFNNADLHFLRELRAALAAKDTQMLDRARKTKVEEISVMSEVDLVLSYNDTEHAVITSHTEGAAHVMLCPWVVKMPSEVGDLGKRRGLSFLGNYRHPPNVEAAHWFCEHVLPALPGNVEFTLYGSASQGMFANIPKERVAIAGHVAELSQAFDPHRIFVAPLRHGAGIKGKVLEALAHGIPCVLSPIAAEGIGLRNGYDCFIADDPDDWAMPIARLSSEDRLWKKISQRGRDFVREKYSFEAGRDQMRKIFASVDLYTPSAR